jgi:hypothetical protein
MRVRLADSLHYLGEFASLPENRVATLTSVEERIKSAPVSPWVFCLYSKLVTEISNDRMAEAAPTFDALVSSLSLPATQGVEAFLGPSIPGAWWEHLCLLLDTDAKRSFKPQASSHEALALTEQEIGAAFALMQYADPILHDEVRHLLRMIVLGAPASSHLDDVFNGASTFFLWGATLLNANLRRSPISMMDLLIHESSHVLLFGLSADGALTRNSADQRYFSPLRSDPRPIDGIFHGCFVATRVHLAMGRILKRGDLALEVKQQALERQRSNGNTGRISLELLERHAELTDSGMKIFRTLRDYWSGISSREDGKEN